MNLAYASSIDHNKGQNYLCLVFGVTEEFKAKITTQGYDFFHFLRRLHFLIWESVNTLTVILRAYSEFDSMHFRTHWLGRNILILMNISSLYKTFSFCIWSCLVPQADFQTSKKKKILDMVTTDLSFIQKNP